MLSSRRPGELRHCGSNAWGDRQSLAFETMLSMSDKVEFIRPARESGFFVRMFFLGTDDQSINSKRVALRVMEGGITCPCADHCPATRARSPTVQLRQDWPTGHAFMTIPSKIPLARLLFRMAAGC